VFVGSALPHEVGRPAPAAAGPAADGRGSPGGRSQPGRPPLLEVAQTSGPGPVSVSDEPQEARQQARDGIQAVLIEDEKKGGRGPDGSNGKGRGKDKGDRDRKAPEAD